MRAAAGIVPNWLLGSSPTTCGLRVPTGLVVRRGSRRRQPIPKAKTDDPTIEPAMEDPPVTVLLGAVGPLLRKLNSISPEQCPPEDIRLLQELCISLKKLSEDEDASRTKQWWMKIVRELCYDAEDHLDDMSAVRDDFSHILARVKDATERLERFQWSPKATIKDDVSWEAAGVRSHTTATATTDTELSIPIFRRPSVGIGEPPKKLVELLALNQDSRTLKVIPIHGCAGVGKTTVARTLYHRYGGEFQCRAFVSVSRNPDMRRLLTSMISQLKAPQPHGIPDAPELIDTIKKHLEDKRYFIVIDDLRTASAWNIISQAFPCGDCCSRIISTTQIEDVALACCSYDSDNIYKMSPLNEYESRQLFFDGVFGSEDGCPTDVKEMAYEIVKKCGGLPFVIVNIAILLASESRENRKNIQDLLASFPDATKDVVNIMYNSLSPCLRTCLLYLSMYPEGYVIKKEECLKHWIAEGLISVVEGTDTEEIAEAYFDELVSRGMVQCVDTSSNGEMLSCTVHQMVLDFIRWKSMEENFVITVNYSQSAVALADKVRRLSVQFGGVKSACIPESIITSQVRSFVFWGYMKCVPSITDYALLRILSLHIWADQDKTSFDLSRIEELFLLKYLNIECNIPVKLPAKIQSLQELGTLILDARLLSVPPDIVNLESLVNLCLPSESILPNGFANMTSLRTLGYFNLSSYSQEDVMHLGRLTNLKDLHLTCSTLQPPAENLKKNVQLLGSVLEKLRGLQSVTLVPVASGSSCTATTNIPCDGFSMASPPSDLLLQRIELSRRCCIFFRLPKWFGLLGKLCILKIAIRGLSGEDIGILKGLPSLTAVTLYILTAATQSIVISNMGFEKLTYFKLVCPAPCLSFEQRAMPQVQKLNLRFNADNMEPHTLETAGYQHLTSLVEICVKLGALSADEFNIKAAKSALEAGVRDHPNNPILRVQCSDKISYSEEEEEEEDKSSTTTCVDKRPEIQESKEKNIQDSDNYLIKKLSNNRYSRTNSISTPWSTQSVDLVTGAIHSLLAKLTYLRSLHKDLLADIKSLYKELQSIQAQLQFMQQEELAKQVRNISYDAEDTIDSFLVRVNYQDGFRDFCRRVIRRTTSRSRSPKIAEFRDAINDIIRMVNDVMRRSLTSEIGDEDHYVANPFTASTSDPPLLPQMVGIEASVDKVMTKLRIKDDTRSLLDIVSIVGMGGSGKTALAKAVYDLAQGQFKYRAFVSLSPQPCMEQVFRNILIQIDMENYVKINAATLNESLLIDELRRLLADKRYFIVIDDIWSMQSWKNIKSALIDNRYGSKVITTSRIFGITTNEGEVYMQNPLSPELSRELFDIISFGGKGECPSYLLDVSAEIIQKCGGLPLAITTVAKLLIGKSNDIDEWSKMSRSLDGGYKDNEDLMNMIRILLSSYNDMPSHLKTCFVYLHIFPKGRVIKKEILIWKWIAEGFIPDEPGMRLFDHGEKYFNELVERCIIMPIEDQRRGTIVGCHVQSVVHEAICYLSVAKDFVSTLESQQHSSSQYKVRRVAIAQNKDTELHDLLGSTPFRQLRSFNATLCRLGALLLSSFEVLRVLAIEECIFKEDHAYHLEQIGGLIQLRYLGLYKTHIYNLPEEIGHLRFLQTLDLRGTRVTELPHSVGQLSQLKCLRADDISTRVPDWIGELTSLEELHVQSVGKSIKFVEELGKLTELRELEIGIQRFDGNSAKALVESIGNLQKLQVLDLTSALPGSDEVNWEGFVPPRQLHDLCMKVASFRLPAWINSSLVPNLSHLSIDVKAVEEQDLENLGMLEKLISLVLSTPSDVFPTIKGHRAFPSLRYFGTCTPVRFLPGTMPCLESFSFKVHKPVTDVDLALLSTLGSLPLLQKVQVEIGDIEAVVRALKHAVDTHPNSPSLDVIKTNQVEITPAHAEDFCN